MTGATFACFSLWSLMTCECVLDDVFTFKTDDCRNPLRSVNEHQRVSNNVKLTLKLSSFFFFYFELLSASEAET